MLSTEVDDMSMDTTKAKDVTPVKLSPYCMEADRIIAVQRMQDYIKQHLEESITLSELAGVSHFSPWYAHRLFTRLTGITPADYIRRMRLSASAMRLRDQKCKVIDAALEAGFDSAEGYQRAFYREFGRNPHEYAESPSPICLFIPYGVKSRYIIKDREESKMEKVSTVFVQVVDKPARGAIIKRGVKAAEYFDYCNEVGCDIWGILKSMPSLCGEPVCLWLPDCYIKPGTSRYVQGVEVEKGYDGQLPDGFDIIMLPAAKYLMFRGEPFEEEDYAEAISAIWEAEKRYDPRLIGYEWDEANPKIQLEPIGERGYVELLPVKPL